MKHFIHFSIYYPRAKFLYICPVSQCCAETFSQFIRSHKKDFLVKVSHANELLDNFISRKHTLLPFRQLAKAYCNLWLAWPDSMAGSHEVVSESRPESAEVP